MTIVYNQYDQPVDFEAAVNLMDNEIREQIHAEGMYDDDPQGFFEAYALAHYDEYNELFCLDGIY